MELDIPTGGTLVAGDGMLWLPYDINGAPAAPLALRPLGKERNVRHATTQAFALDYRQNRTVHLINAMGVALGDSIIGLSALHWLLSRHSRLRLQLYRAGKAPDYVEQLYRLAAGWLGPVQYLPVSLDQMPANETVVDLGDIMHWPEFARMPMIDFFFWALGVDASQVPTQYKRNHWLSRLPLPYLPGALREEPYVLFCPQASCALRSIPRALRADYVDRLWSMYGMPVRGCVPIDHPRYVRSNEWAADTQRFIALVAGAKALAGVDSAAVHIAAGFDIPTLAWFNTIAPELRVAHYPRCKPVDLRLPQLEGLHASQDPALLALAHKRWKQALTQDWPAPGS